MDPRTAAVVALIAIAPIVVVMLVAMLRGYDIILKMVRPRKRGSGEDG